MIFDCRRLAVYAEVYMENRKVLVFAGTTEGRKLTQYLLEQGIEVCVCVATEYGESLLPKGEGLTVSHERMDAEQMEQKIRDYRPAYVIDATHPYASQVTGNIKEACRAGGWEYLRLIRERSETENCILTGSIEEAVAFLEHTEGNILAATGSKELEAYTRLTDYKTRVYARVLSLADVVKKCEDLEITGRHLICMQGPFSAELNLAMLREYDIQWFVTKESGKTGGFPEKQAAAREAGAKLVVVGRPAAEEGYDLEEMCRLLSVRLRLLQETPRKRRRVSLVGIGTGCADQFTLQAKKACREAELLIGAGRMVQAASRPGQDTYVSYRPEEIAAYIREHPGYRKIAVVFSGDVGCYSGAKKLLPLLEAETEDSSLELEVIPGISSVVYFCARLGTSWEDAALVSMHGKQANVISAVRENKKTIVLAGNGEGIRRLCQEMVKYGYGDLKVSAGENLSYPEERIVTGSAKQLCQYEGGGLAVLCIENPCGGRRWIGGGIPDDQFLRGAVPMTKEEVRNVCLSKLRLREDSILYDVGSGTGSVAVEAALLARQGEVYAIERKDEAAALIYSNKYRFGTDNLYVVHGEAPEALRGLPSPDSVFIGGSGGNLKEILSEVMGNFRDVRIVISAISLETVAEAVQSLKEWKNCGVFRMEEEEILQLSVAKSKTVGKYHMMMGQNPIFVISFTARKLSGSALDGEDRKGEQ